jgi:hypothetical protein
VVTAAALSACVAPGLNPAPKPKPPVTTKPKPPPTTTKPPTCSVPSTGAPHDTPEPTLTSLAQGEHVGAAVGHGVFRVPFNSWVQTWNAGAGSAPTFGAPEAQPAGPGVTNQGTWLATIFADDQKIMVGGGPLTAIDTSNPAHKVDPLAGHYTNGAYLVGFDVPTGCYRLTSPPGGTAQYEIFVAYSTIRECSTPSGATSVCHAGGTTINMRFTGSRALELEPGDYILHYIGTLTKTG